MKVILRERLQAGDPIQGLLYAGGSALFPGGHFLAPAAVERRLKHLAARPRDPAAVKALLARENAFAPLFPAQEAALEEAGQPGTVFLLTGQQPGLLGGPVLWLYKALTCVAVADAWRMRLSRPVVPVFWVAGDDSDLAEVNHLELLDSLPPETPPVLSLPFPDPARPLKVGARPVDAAAMKALLFKLANVWDDATLGAIRAWLPSGGSLADCFQRLAWSRLGSKGMLFLRGDSKAVAAAARPVLERAARDWRRHQGALARGTEAVIAAGIEPPVSLREGVVHAFAIREGERHRLFAEAAEGSAGDSRLYCAEDPGRDLMPGLAGLELSHDVFTRPLVAEAALPVLGHVLGPAELRYFAQMAPLFLEETGDMPLVHPRMSAAVMPESALEAFTRAGLGAAEAATFTPSKLRTLLQKRAWKAHPAAKQGGAMAAGLPAPWMDGLRAAHGKHFPDNGPLDRLERRLRGSWKRYLRSLERMAYASSPKNGQDLFQALRWLGNGAGQDRHMNLHSLLAALGPKGLDALLAAVDAAEPGLQVFTYAGRKEA